MIVYKKGEKVNKKFKILLYIVIIGLGYGVGNLIGYYAGEQLSSQEAPNIYLIIVTLLFGIILQIIIHEAGHLFFGLLSGYKFISFKVFNFAIVKDEENKIKKYLNILKENIIEAKQAKKSKIIVKETEKSYLEYLDIENKLKDLRENLDNLLEEQKLNIQYQNNIKILKLNNENLKTDIINLEENISKNSEKKEKVTKKVIPVKKKIVIKKLLCYVIYKYRFSLVKNGIFLLK